MSELTTEAAKAAAWDQLVAQERLRAAEAQVALAQAAIGARTPDPAPAPDTAPSEPAALTFEDVKGMTTDEITSRWPEVQKALAEGPK